MFKVEIQYKDGASDTFDSVTSIGISMAPSYRELTDDEIRTLKFGSSKDIYIFNEKSHLIAANTFKRLSVEG